MDKLINITEEREVFKIDESLRRGMFECKNHAFVSVISNEFVNMDVNEIQKVNRRRIMTSQIMKAFKNVL